MNKPECSFLHEKNPRLHTSPEVECAVDYLRSNGEDIPNQPSDKIAAYLGFLASKGLVNDGILTGNQVSIDRQVHAMVIKTHNVPENYFDLQRRIARENGEGEIDIAPHMRSGYIRFIQQDQLTSLHKWTDYFAGNGQDLYSDWFKFYVWESVIKLADFDKSRKQFRKRSKSTTAAFPELNQEALAIVFSKMSIENEDDIDDSQWSELVQSGNFNKLYSHALWEARTGLPSDEELEVTTGDWRRYPQGNNHAIAKSLADSLHGRGTGWCTSSQEMASLQLQGGDFYVYYSCDRFGKNTIPRLAILTVDGFVREVRGIVGGTNAPEAGQNTNQEIESSMVEIVGEKLKLLPGGQVYKKKVEDMKRLTSIDILLKNNQEYELCDSDLRFIYELDSEIEGFGYGRDPRIKEIRKHRDWLGDISMLLQTKDQQEIYKILIDKKLGHMVAENISVLVDLNQEDVFKELYHRVEYTSDLEYNMHNFDKISNDLKASFMVNSGNGIELGDIESVSSYLQQFSNLGVNTAQALLNASGPSTLAELLSCHKFIGLSRNIATTLIAREHGEAVVNNIDAFELSEDSYKEILLQLFVSKVDSNLLKKLNNPEKIMNYKSLISSLLSYEYEDDLHDEIVQIPDGRGGYVCEFMPDEAALSFYFAQSAGLENWLKDEINRRIEKDQEEESLAAEDYISFRNYDEYDTNFEDDFDLSYFFER